jgi:hypothetical protein
VSDEELIALHERMRKEAFDTVGSAILERFFEVKKENTGAPDDSRRNS